MDGAVPDNGLLALGGAPETDTTDGAALNRRADGEELRVGGERGLEVDEELVVLGPGVVRVEVRDVGHGSSADARNLEGGCVQLVSNSQLIIIRGRSHS